MQRRRFVRRLLAVPALSTALDAGQSSPPSATPQQQPQPTPNTPARQEPRQASGAPKLRLTAPDVTAEPSPHFFTDAQFETLKKLGAVLVPPLKSNPGAVEAKAAEFLDFLIGCSSIDRQKSYQFGLDQLNQQARARFQRSFAELDDRSAGVILKPLLVVRPWPEDLPSDPLQSFLAQVHEDLRTATTNSREWADAFAKSGRAFSRAYRATGYYWAPIDPVS